MSMKFSFIYGSSKHESIWFVDSMNPDHNVSDIYSQYWLIMCAHSLEAIHKNFFFNFTMRFRGDKRWHISLSSDQGSIASF